jgi:hypothetical protein
MVTRLLSSLTLTLTLTFLLLATECPVTSSKLLPHSLTHSPLTCTPPSLKLSPLRTIHSLTHLNGGMSKNNNNNKPKIIKKSLLKKEKKNEKKNWTNVMRLFVSSIVDPSHSSASEGGRKGGSTPPTLHIPMGGTSSFTAGSCGPGGCG